MKDEKRPSFFILHPSSFSIPRCLASDAPIRHSNHFPCLRIHCNAMCIPLQGGSIQNMAHLTEPLNGLLLIAFQLGFHAQLVRQPLMMEAGSLHGRAEVHVEV